MGSAGTAVATVVLAAVPLIVVLLPAQLVVRTAACFDDPDRRRAEADLQASYRRVAVTATGYGELWVRRDRPSLCG